MSIEVYPLGAGQEVGRSCIIINIDDKTIMLDCGLHMTHYDQRRFPDFKKIPPNSTGQSRVDLVLITHFHLDHCGALPYFTEIHGYNGPVIMTMPTKALLPYMLEDYRRVWTDTQGVSQKQEQNQQTIGAADPLLIYNQEQIRLCVNKVEVINIMETQEHNGIEIKAYYAGHLLGACMFYIKYKGRSFVYTGDFNSMSDRHLGAAYIDRLEPDLLISESTYATTIRDSKRTRERNFLMHVQQVLDNGGKVLIPVFALGRAQELSVLLDTYWQRTGNKFGLYFAAGLIEKANQYYKLFLNWESEKIQNSFSEENIFDFKHIQTFDRQLIKSQDPMVLLATPGMLHGGLSMQVFKEWCSSENNSIVIPGYCVAGTLGNKLLQGLKKIRIDNKDYEVKMNVQNMSFSAHADSKGIIQLVKHLSPKNVMFVHGEAQKMKTLGKLIEEQMKIPVFCPENFQLVQLDSKKEIQLNSQINLNQHDLQILSQQQELLGYYLECNIKNVSTFYTNVDKLLFEANFIISQLEDEQLNFNFTTLKKYIIARYQQECDFNAISSFIEEQSILPLEIIQGMEHHERDKEIWIPYLNDNQTDMIMEIKKLIEE